MGVLAIGVLGYLLGLWNATLELNEKGFYGMSFVLSLFVIITVQKNIRDLTNNDDPDKQLETTYQNLIRVSHVTDY